MTDQDQNARDPGLYPYFPYPDRPRLHWPNGARIAFWVAPNIEYYELNPPPAMGRKPWPRPVPDILGYSYRDYANRSGVWRMMDVLAKREVRASISLSVAICDHYPEIIAAGNALGWEWFSHGIYNTRYITGLSSAQERAIIRDSKRTILDRTGQKLAGWLGPSLSNSYTIADNLAAEGLDYTLDLFHDDQPTPLNVAQGRLISIPYSLVVNDALMFHQWRVTPSDWLDMLKRQFDQLYLEGSDNPTVMAVPLHPYLIGQPNRIAALDELLVHVTGHQEVWLPTAREIAAWYYEHHYDAVVAAQHPRKAAHDVIA